MYLLSLFMSILCLLFHPQVLQYIPANGFPQLLQVTQTTSVTRNPGATLRLTLPDTARPDVTQAVCTRLQEMHSDTLSHLSLYENVPPVLCDTGAVFTRSGPFTLSFLLLSQITTGHEGREVSLDSMVFDMYTGRRCLMSDFVTEDAWDTIEKEFVSQIQEFYPQQSPDLSRLRQTVSRSSLKQVPFTVGVTGFELHVPSSLFYDGKTLLHIHIPYRSLEGQLTRYGQYCTNNRPYPKIALTFDDGPAHLSTRSVMDSLREYGASATFFLIGERLSVNHDILFLQQNAGLSLQSHSLSHNWTLTPDQLLEEFQQMSQELSSVTGVYPSMIRIPGGNEKRYAASLPLPMIHWTISGGDAGGSISNPVRFSIKTTARLQDGDILLLHDLTPNCFEYTRLILKDLTLRGFQCVTVQELFELADAPLLPGHVYFAPLSERVSFP